MFDALTTRRVYRPPFTYERGVAMMRSERGSHFDPDVLDAFLLAERAIKPIMHEARLLGSAR